MKTLIIGYGSTLRRDDGIGYLVAEKLLDEHEAAPHPQRDVIARQQLTPDLADALSQCDHVIFIDACADAAPGEVRTREVKPNGENWGAFVHEMSPEVLLGCVQDLFHRVPRAHLINIGGQDFGIGEGLTPEINAAIPLVLDEVGHLESLTIKA